MSTVMDLYAPSQKQIDFANAISKVLDIPLPTVFIKGSYQAFIFVNIDKYNDEKEYWRQLNDEADMWEYDLMCYEPE